MAYEDLTHILRGYSKAMYATWFFYRPDHLLFDAGEGVACHLDNAVFGIQAVFLSHGHIDHISGLPTLVHIRSAGMGEKEKPLTVYYPEGDRYVPVLSQYIRRTNPGLTFELRWEPLQPGQRLELSQGSLHGRTLETFQTQHIPGRLSLGFNILEKRRKLRPEFAHLSEAEIRAHVRAYGRERLTYEYEQKLLSYAGDSMPVQADAVGRTDLLLHEATFLTSQDRQRKVHATLEETLDVAEAAEVKGVLLFHISSRYSLLEVRREVRKQARHRRLELPIWLWWNEKLERLV